MPEDLSPQILQGMTSIWAARRKDIKRERERGQIADTTYVHIDVTLHTRTDIEIRLFYSQHLLSRAQELRLIWHAWTCDCWVARYHRNEHKMEHCQEQLITETRDCITWCKTFKHKCAHTPWRVIAGLHLVRARGKWKVCFIAGTRVAMWEWLKHGGNWDRSLHEASCLFCSKNMYSSRGGRIYVFWIMKRAKSCDERSSKENIFSSVFLGLSA